MTLTYIYLLKRKVGWQAIELIGTYLDEAKANEAKIVNENEDKEYGAMWFVSKVEAIQ